MPLHVIICYMHPYCRGLQMFASLQDAWTPLKVVGAVAVINLAGDYWLIIQKGLGAVGAGITCPVAQYFGAIVFMVYLHRMGKREKGIRLSWQVTVTAHYFYCLGTSPKHERQASTRASLLNILAVPDQQFQFWRFWPDTPCPVSCMSLQLCASTACRLLLSLSQYTYKNRASLFVLTKPRYQANFPMCRESICV